MNNQLPLYILVNLISFGCGFALTWFFDYKKSMDGELENTYEELEDIKLESEDILNFPVEVVIETDVKEKVWPRYSKYLDIIWEYFRNAEAQGPPLTH